MFHKLSYIAIMIAVIIIAFSGVTGVRSNRTGRWVHLMKARCGRLLIELCSQERRVSPRPLLLPLASPLPAFCRCRVPSDATPSQFDFAMQEELSPRAHQAEKREVLIEIYK